jgi:hypothetical protein
VLACLRVAVAVEMPFSSTFAAAAGATERLRGCTIAPKIALLAKLESANSAIFRASVQPRRRSVAPSAGFGAFPVVTRDSTTFYQL